MNQDLAKHCSVCFYTRCLSCLLSFGVMMLKYLCFLIPSFCSKMGCFMGFLTFWVVDDRVAWDPFCSGDFFWWVQTSHWQRFLGHIGIWGAHRKGILLFSYLPRHQVDLRWFCSTPLIALAPQALVGCSIYSLSGKPWIINQLSCFEDQCWAILCRYWHFFSRLCWFYEQLLSSFEFYYNFLSSTKILWSLMLLYLVSVT